MILVLNVNEVNSLIFVIIVIQSRVIGLGIRFVAVKPRHTHVNG